MKRKVLICGFGKMGRVHFNSLCKLDPGLEKFDITIVDRNDAVFNQLPEEARESVTTYTDLDSALASDPELVVMAFNDDQHLAAFEKIKQSSSVRGVFAEKPLCKTRDEAEQLRPYFTGQNAPFLSIHTVINFSDIFDIAEERFGQRLDGYEPILVEASWGKNRTKDTRPTIGVVSDLTHPLSIINDVLGFDKMIWQSGNAKKGHLAEAAGNVVWHYDKQVLSAGDVPVRLESSYGWGAQNRRVKVLFQKDQGNMCAVEYNFDIRAPGVKPYDAATLYDVSGGAVVTLETYNTRNAVNQNKALNYMRKSLEGYEAYLTGRSIPARLTDFEDAMEIHAVTDAISTNSQVTIEHVDPENLASAQLTSWAARNSVEVLENIPNRPQAEAPYTPEV